MQGYANHILFFFILLISFASCNPEPRQQQSNEPPARIDLVRFEQELSNIDTGNIDTAVRNLISKYPEFSEIAFYEILGMPRSNEQFNEQVLFMIQDSGYREISRLVQNKYNNLDQIKNKLSIALENYSNSFESISSLPKIYTFFSGFSYQCFVFEENRREAVGIGLELFLGTDFEYSKIDPGNPSFSQYLVRSYNQDHLVKKVIEVLIEDKIPPPATPNFLSLMLWGGKKLYLMDEILNNEADSVVFEFTPEQLAWCRSNESQMWSYFFEKDLFFKTDIQSFNKFIAPSPYSPGMPSEAPGRTGTYIGYRIVQSYMDRYPNTTIEELISFTDAQKFLELSKFKPSAPGRK